MKIVVFCGGTGTRLWPLSRKNTPKQFTNVVGDMSMLQSMIARLTPRFKLEDILISTGKQYLSDIKKQLPQISEENIITEPEMRDTGPAVCYAIATVKKRFGGDVPVAVLWGGDHVVKNEKLFNEVLEKAEELVLKGQKIAYIGILPRFPSINLGYIQYGEVIDKPSDKNWEIRKFSKFTEKPDLKKAEQFLTSGDYVWNPGYFVSTPDYILSYYEKYASDTVNKIWQVVNENKEEIYAAIEKRAMDYILNENIKKEDAIIILCDLGWSDVGEWQSLKEAMSEKTTDNLIRGNHLNYQSTGCIVYSYSNQAIATVGCENLVVVATDDVLLVCPLKRAPEVKKLVEQLKTNTETIKYT